VVEGVIELNEILREVAASPGTGDETVDMATNHKSGSATAAARL
jgi:hypothetical protein